MRSIAGRRPWYLLTSLRYARRLACGEHELHPRANARGIKLGSNKKSNTFLLLSEACVSVPLTVAEKSVKMHKIMR
jgi:hypothetical protein